MDQIPSPIPQKSSSFTSSRGDDKLRDSDRNLSLSSLHFHPINDSQQPKEDENHDDNEDDEEISNQSDLLSSLSNAIDQFLNNPSPDIPISSIESFTALLEKEIAKHEISADDDDPAFLDSVDRAFKLAAALSASNSHHHLSAIAHRAMTLLEDDFHSLITHDDSPSSKSKKPSSDHNPNSKPKRRSSFSFNLQPNPSDHPTSPTSPSAAADPISPLPDHQSIARLRRIANAMIAHGYQPECCQVYTVARRNAMNSIVSDKGFDKLSIDDILRMPWETLESEIGKWTKAFRHVIHVSFPQERELCESVYDGIHRPVVDGILRSLSRSILIQLLTFAEAVSMTKRSAEKLFKVLDMYEALGEMMVKLEEIFDADVVDEDVKMDLSSVRARIGEAAVFIFCDLEMSIKCDTAKQPVLSGAVHPLTRYVVNYLKYACEYKNTLEQVFKDHRQIDVSTAATSLASCDGDGDGDDDNSARDGGCSAGSSGRCPLFSSQVVQVMDLLNSNLESKANLYKDLSLSSIFMMNNGRYIVQKIKASAEIKELLGETWCRKKSSDLRRHHKNYQRETWSKILGCFKDEGLQVKGAVLKPVLKERFKSFNSMFEEIHKTQSGWLVSDEQLQSELRVSVSAVVVPAYRSFLGRFGQYLDSGRQTEKYIKFGPEDLESYIDELFDGNPIPVMKRKS